MVRLALLLCPMVVLAEAPAPTIALVEPGAAPREVLRYGLETGSKGEVRVTTSLSTEQDTAGRRSTAVLPDTRFDFGVEVTSASPERFDATLRMAQAAALPRKGASPAARGALKKAWDELKGLRVLMTVTAAGVPEAAKLKMPRQPDAVIADGVRALAQTVRDLQVRLPAEAVGVGARWTVEDVVQTADGPVVRTTTWTLRGREGNRLTLAFEATQAGEAGRALSGLPDGMTARVERLTGRATGAMQVDLRRPVPLEMTQQGELALVIAGETGGKAFTMTTTVRTSTRVETRKP